MAALACGQQVACADVVRVVASLPGHAAAARVSRHKLGVAHWWWHTPPPWRQRLPQEGACGDPAANPNPNPINPNPIALALLPFTHNPQPTTLAPLCQPLQERKNSGCAFVESEDAAATDDGDGDLGLVGASPSSLRR